MKERILKRERTKKGDEFMVAAQQVASTELSGDVGSLTAQLEGEAGLPEDPDQAEQLLVKAEQQAQSIAGRAEEEAQQLRRQADEETRQLREAAAAELAQKRRVMEGEIRRELETQYGERYSAAVTALEAAAADLRERQEQYLAQIEQPALSLVLAIGRQLLGAELSRSPEFIAGLIARAFQLMKPQQVVYVALDAEIHRRLEEDELLTGALRRAGIKPELVAITADEALAPGQFTAEVGGMSVDYNLDEVITELTAQIEKRAASLADGSGKERS